MNNAKETIESASGWQHARLGLIITNGVIDAIRGKLNTDEMQEILRNEDFIRKASEKITAELLNIPIDPWAGQKKKIERFYKSIFNLTIDWSKVSLPAYDEKYPRLEYVHGAFHRREYIDGYKKKFGDSSVGPNPYSQTPDSAVKTEQDHPKGNYCFAWKGTIEPDQEHLNKSYNDFCSDGNQYMIPKEGIIVAFRERFESGNMLDIKGLTRFHALDFGDCTMDMRRNGGGRFEVGFDSRGDRNSFYGPRQIRF
ncbi:MAG: hypothetical protein KBB75_00170 [Candidatus Pacebacteria bacterium]|jgi:hypothetical protein|nr:hypothetical protein [Candidatus Paceibacterota bacterium]